MSQMHSHIWIEYRNYMNYAVNFAFNKTVINVFGGDDILEKIKTSNVQIQPDMRAIYTERQTTYK